MVGGEGQRLVLGKLAGEYRRDRLVVCSCTVVAFRYQVESSARRAKFGYRTASISPAAFMSEVVGSSSSTIQTTGGLDRGGATAAVATSPWNVIFETGDAIRKNPAKTSGAGARGSGRCGPCARGRRRAPRDPDDGEDDEDACPVSPRGA